ncbi:unnamed protein product [Phaeothamnion confervicola]
MLGPPVVNTGRDGEADEMGIAAVSIDAKNFRRTLQQIERGHEVCCSVIYSFLFTVLFVVVVIMHLQPTTTYQVEATISKEYGFSAVTDVSSYWTWLTEIVVPVSFKQYDDVGNPLDPADWSRISTYNSLVAGVRLRTWRVEGEDCPDDALTPLYGQTACYPRRGGAASVADYGLPACNYSNTDVACYNETKYAGIVNVTYNEGFRVDPDADHFEFFLDKYDKLYASQLRVGYAQDRHWLDQATTETEVEILTYNGELDIFCLLQMKVTFNRGGAVERNIIISSAFAESYPSNAYYFWDAVFFLVVLLKLVMELRELWPFLRARKPMAYFRETEDGWWNLIDWVALLLCVLLIGFWLKYAAEVHEVSKKLQHLGDENLYISERISVNRGFLNSDFYQYYLTEINQANIELRAAVETKNIVRYLAAFNSFMIIVRFFKVARFLPRANLLVKTVAIALVDLIHYAAVFLFVLAGFAVEGWMVFGHRVAAFGTLWDAVQTSMLVVMGAADTTTLYSNMMDVSEMVTILWFWGFFFVMILLVMNLLIAIIIDAYAAARGSLKDRENLWGEVIHISRIVTLYWRPGYMRPSDLLNCFAVGGSLHGYDSITADILVDRVKAPGAPGRLRRLVICCFRRRRGGKEQQKPRRRWKQQASLGRLHQLAHKGFGDVAPPVASRFGGDTGLSGADISADGAAPAFGSAEEKTLPLPVYPTGFDATDDLVGDRVDKVSGASIVGGSGSGGDDVGKSAGAGAGRRHPFRIRFRGTAGAGAAAVSEEDTVTTSGMRDGHNSGGGSGSGGGGSGGGGGANDHHHDDGDSVRGDVHLDRLYAEYLILDACEDKMEGDDAHGMTLSDAAKEISDALIRVKLMGERFSNVENMLVELLQAQPSRAGTPHRVRFRPEVPEPPMTRRALGRMASMMADMEQDQAASGAVASRRQSVPAAEWEV